MVDRESLVYKTNKQTYSFKHFRTINIFGRDIYNGKTTLKEVDEDQSNVSVEIMDFKKKSKTTESREKAREKNFLKHLHVLSEERERVLDALESKIFPIKSEGTGFENKVFDHSNLNILAPKQMLKRLLIALA